VAGGALDAFLDFVFPRRCAGCGQTGAWFCTACAAQARRAPPAPDGFHAVFVLEGPLREAVHRLKYADRPQLAGPLAAVMADALDRVPAGALVPVPLHPRRRRRRGYNQAELLARELGPLLGRPVWDGLRRVRDTPAQVGRGGADRRAALAGAFACPGVPPAEVVLVDDVVTTGATMVAAAAALRAAGAVRIAGIALALG
jgi:ComF family protein